MLKKFTWLGALTKLATAALILLATLLMKIGTATAADVFTADAFYQQQNYEKALLAYLAAAETGSPHAYYQLGTLYYKGQGTTANNIDALLWFSLAAEHQFNDAENIVNQLLDSMDEKNKTNIRLLMARFIKKYGKELVEKQYLPELIKTNLDKKVTFGGIGKNVNNHDVSNELFGLKTIHNLSDFTLGDDYNNSFDNSFDSPFIDSFEFEEAGENGSVVEEFGDVQGSQPQKRNPLDLPYLAVIDYEVAPDGSLRNIMEEYSQGRAGNIKTAIYNYSLYNFPKPTFEGERIKFIHRGYLGIARYKSAQARDKYKDLYAWVRSTNKKLEKENTHQSKYKRAMLLLYYPWLPQVEGLAVSILKTLSEEGYVNSQYQYGLYLYREQVDVEQGIKWLSLASQFGLAKAQYALAGILQESPWVVSDELKAMFWYEKAAQKAQPNALLKLAELKLIAKDETLRDQTEAINILNTIKQAQYNNPEYHYLVAISHLNGEYRDMPKVISNLRQAISRGNTLNWDVSVWENQLARWTKGSVTITEW